MLTKRKTIFLALIAITLVSVICAFVCLNTSKSTIAYASSEIVGGDDITVTEKVSDPFDENRTGISLSTSKSGARAEFGKTFNGDFVIDLKSKGEKGKVPNLKSFSIVFTDNESGDAFALKVAYSEEKVQTSSAEKAKSCLVTDLSVVYGDQRAGIYYRETNSMPYEFTSDYNNQDKYTRFYYGENALITFDASDLILSVADKTAKNQNYVLKIWDFKKEVNDGKKLVNNLKSFSDYKVEIVFDEIAANKTGELVVYGIADGEDNIVFDKEGIADVNAEVKFNAVVGEQYEIPKADVSKTIKNDSDSNVVVSVKRAATEIEVKDGKFIPSAAGEYVIRYAYVEEGKELAVKEYKINAVTEVKSNIVLDSEFNDVAVGLNATLTIPSATVETNLAANKKARNLSVKILKDGVTLRERKRGGFDFSFSAVGEYEVIYRNDDFGYEKTYIVTVSDGELGIVMPTVPEKFDLNAIFDATPLKAYYNGEKISSTITLQYPSGKTIVGTSFKLDELGYYTVRYDYEAGGNEYFEQKEFVTEKPFETMFEYNDATVKYGVSSYNSTLDGALFTVKNNTVITYTDVIDLSKYFFDDTDSYENKNSDEKYLPLIEIAAVPSIMGSADLTTIFVTLTDIEDETNTMMIRLRLAEAGSSLTKIRAKGKNQVYTGQNFKWNSTYTGIDSYIVENAPAHEFGGFSSSHNFTQAQGNNKTSDTTCKLYYDYEKNALYSKPMYSKIGNDVLQWLVCDFDDDDFFATPWTGFRKGLAKLSVSFAGVEGSADILIRSINGDKFEGDLLNDEIIPSIEVDFGEDDAAPYGQVGEEYRVPEFTAADNSGIITKKGFKVYYDGKEIETDGQSFVPELTGYYTIRYSATDSFGNTCFKDVSVRVMSYVSKPIIEIDGEIPEKAKFGDVITLPAISAKGGAGNNETIINVTCGGEEIDVTDNEIVCEKTGTYVITLKVKDHLGKTDEIVYFVNVTFENAPTFNENEIVLPPSFVAGEEFVFGRYYADYYASETAMAEKVVGKISVTENGTEKAIAEDGKYTPSANADVTEVAVRISFERQGAKTTVFEKTVPVTHISESSRFMEKYFVTENIETTSNSQEISFAAKEAGKKTEISFIRPVSARNFSLDIKTGEFKYKSLTVILKDCEDSGSVAEIKYFFGGDTVECYVGGMRKEVYLKDGILGVNFDAETFDITDKNGVWSGEITENKNGTAFTGFASGKVYMSIVISDVSEGAVIGLTRIGDQNFNYLGSDMVKPTLKINGNLSGKFGINSVITTPVAEASDILFAVKSITLTIIDPSEKVVFTGDATKAYEVTLGQYGVYQFVYNATDSSRKGNVATETKTITVYDSTAPELKFDREMITEINVGYKYVLPTYTVIDNAPAEESTVHITVITPRGLAETVTDGSVKFLYKGTYKITYFVIDADGNNNLYSFEIIAKEG